MGQEETRIQKELVEKEELLLDNAVRTDAARIQELIADSSVEITASGRQFVYRPGALFEKIQGALYIDSNTVQLIDISGDCKLLVYVAARVVKNARMKSSCSSIWKKVDGTWKVVFHQETNVSEA